MSDKKPAFIMFIIIYLINYHFFYYPNKSYTIRNFRRAVVKKGKAIKRS